MGTQSRWAMRHHQLARRGDLRSIILATHAVAALVIMLAIQVNSLSYAPAMMRARAPVMSFADDFTVESKPWTSAEVSDKAGLEALAKKLNPVVGYWGACSKRLEAALAGEFFPRSRTQSFALRARADPLNIGDSSPETMAISSMSSPR